MLRQPVSMLGVDGARGAGRPRGSLPSSGPCADQVRQSSELSFYSGTSCRRTGKGVRLRAASTRSGRRLTTSFLPDGDRARASRGNLTVARPAEISRRRRSISRREGTRLQRGKRCEDASAAAGARRAVAATGASVQRRAVPGRQVDLQSATPRRRARLDLHRRHRRSCRRDGLAARVGDNVFANAPQSAARWPVGRSETTLTMPQNVLAGWNDAQGFCGVPFGAVHAPGAAGPVGLRVLTDGGQTWTDGGASDPLGTDILTRGDPWMDDNARARSTTPTSPHKTTRATLGERFIAPRRRHVRGTTCRPSTRRRTQCRTPTLRQGSARLRKNTNRNDARLAENFQELCGFRRTASGRSRPGGRTTAARPVGPVDRRSRRRSTRPLCAASAARCSRARPRPGPERRRVRRVAVRAVFFAAGGVSSGARSSSLARPTAAPCSRRSRRWRASTRRATTRRSATTGHGSTTTADRRRADRQAKGRTARFHSSVTPGTRA